MSMRSLSVVDGIGWLVGPLLGACIARLGVGVDVRPIPWFHDALPINRSFAAPPRYSSTSATRRPSDMVGQARFELALVLDPPRPDARNAEARRPRDASGSFCLPYQS